MADQNPFPHSQNYTSGKSCKICEMAFTNQGDLNNHIASTHFMSGQQMFARNRWRDCDRMIHLDGQAKENKAKENKTVSSNGHYSCRATVRIFRPHNRNPATTYDPIQGYTEAEITSPPLRPQGSNIPTPLHKPTTTNGFPNPNSSPSHSLRLI
ncbi:hypothetical protein BDD12DRAFT_808375 [Trichophaea hybrida]|nr:hypothetical protein BDD12DRAFT_808375 [Trichophaea hybrida]